MTRPRSRANELAQLFEDAARPVYVVDEDRTIVYRNAACAAWLGPAAEGLVGRRCDYHSSERPKESDAVAARLCPPPDALAGRPCVASIIIERVDDSPRRRLARFCPIVAHTDDVLATVVVVDSADSDSADTSESEAARRGVFRLDGPLDGSLDEDADARRLHERILRFRREAAGRFRMDRLFGRSPASRLARARVELAVASRAHVQIVGPPGSGREHTARAIHHAADPARQGSLVPLACSALTDDMIRSTLAALAANPLGEGEATSTLLLNNADRLPLALHAELAAWLAQPTTRIRVIATTAAPLESLAAEGRFSRELALLLSPIVVTLPALADRREDVPLLAQWFLEDLNTSGGKQVGGFTPEALDLLGGYSWPGNADELAQVVAHAHQAAERPLISPNDLPERIHLAAGAAAHPPRPPETIDLDAFLARIERELIERALAEARGNKAQAARLLGLTRPRLYRRLEQLGMAEGE